MRSLLRTFFIGTLKRLPTPMRIFIGSQLMRSARWRASLAAEIAPEIVADVNRAASALNRETQP